MAEKMAWHTQEVRETAQSISSDLTKAAKPGPVPLAAGASPIDVAAAAVAAEIAAQVTKSSSDIGSRAPDGLTKTQTAMNGAEAKDHEEALRIKSVTDGMVADKTPPGTGAIQAAGHHGQWDPWDDDDIIREPVPIIPPFAGPGPGVVPGGGVPASLI